jgi:ubiquinone/menaquinone biosynthesis C-methylase UbiE
MTNLTGAARAQYVQAMFTRIASRYDLMNRLMTFGKDRYWRREVIKRAALPLTGGLLLDLGGGTGDLGLESLRRNPTTIPIEADFTLEMMRVGQIRPGTRSSPGFFSVMSLTCLKPWLSSTGSSNPVDAWLPWTPLVPRIAR